MPRVSLAHAKRGDRRVLEQLVGGQPGGVDVVGDAYAETADVLTGSLHRRLPAAAPVLADARGLLPAEPGDPVVPLLEQVLGGQPGTVGAVDVGPGVVGTGLVPGPAEGHEGSTTLAQEAGLRRTGVGVGDHEGVHGGGAQQVVVPVERVVGVAREQQHVVPGARGRLGEAVQEPVHQRVAGALLGGLEAQPDQVRGAGAQLAGGPVGRVAEAFDDRLHPDAASPAAAARGCSARWRRSVGRLRPRRPPSRASEASPARTGGVRAVPPADSLSDSPGGSWAGSCVSPKTLDRSNPRRDRLRHSTSYPGTVGSLA